MLGHIAQYIFYPIVERYLGRDVRSKWKHLHRYFKKDFTERDRILRKRMIGIVQSAYKNVPYYRDLFVKIKFDPDKLEKDFKYIQDIPLLTKKIIKESGDRILNENLNKDELTACKTGGSTGISMNVYYSKEAVDWTSATNMYVIELAGKKRHMKEIHLASKYPEQFPLKDRIKEHIKCFAMNRANIFTNSFEEKDLREVWQKLKKTKPYLIQGHPSTLYALSKYCNEQRIDTKNVIQVFESTGEVLNEKKKNLIEEVFDCRAVNRYGNAEFGVIAYDPQGGNCKLKVIDYMIYPESLVTTEGENEIVVTGLTNHAMPMIRYCTGDLGEIEKKSDGYYYSKIQGRTHDIITIGEKKYPTHYLQDLLDRIGNITEFQVRQKDSQTILLKLILEPDADEDFIKHKIKSWWGEHVEFEVTDFNGLERSGWRGKFRYLC